MLCLLAHYLYRDADGAVASDGNAQHVRTGTLMATETLPAGTIATVTGFPSPSRFRADSGHVCPENIKLVSARVILTYPESGLHLNGSPDPGLSFCREFRGRSHKGKDLLAVPWRGWQGFGGIGRDWCWAGRIGQKRV
jgi:hypothetical protein